MGEEGAHIRRRNADKIADPNRSATMRFQEASKAMRRCDIGPDRMSRTTAVVLKISRPLRDEVAGSECVQSCRSIIHRRIIAARL